MPRNLAEIARVSIRKFCQFPKNFDEGIKILTRFRKSRSTRKMQQDIKAPAMATRKFQDCILLKVYTGSLRWKTSILFPCPSPGVISYPRRVSEAAVWGIYRIGGDTQMELIEPRFINTCMGRIQGTRRQKSRFV